MNVPFLQNATFTGLISTKDYGTSESWYNANSFIQSASSNWENTSTTVQSNSSNWDSAYTFVQANSASEAFSCEETTGSTDGLVTWNLSFDTIGGFSNNTFTVPAGKAGLYMFNTAIFYDLPSDTQTELGIYVNDNRVRAIYTGTFDGVQGQAQVFGVINLAEGDAVNVKVNFFDDAGAVVRTDGGVSWFTGVKL